MKTIASEEMQRVMLNIESDLVKQQAEDPLRFTYKCPTCSDSGFRVYQRLVRQQTVWMGGACRDCPEGALAQRAETAARDRIAINQAKAEARRQRRDRLAPYKAASVEDDGDEF